MLNELQFPKNVEDCFLKPTFSSGGRWISREVFRNTFNFGELKCLRWSTYIPWSVYRQRQTTLMNKSASVCRRLWSVSRWYGFSARPTHCCPIIRDSAPKSSLSRLPLLALTRWWMMGDVLLMLAQLLLHGGSAAPWLAVPRSLRTFVGSYLPAARARDICNRFINTSCTWAVVEPILVFSSLDIRLLSST